MGRQPCCEKVGLKRGPWTADEDRKLINFILNNGHCCWRAVPKLAGLLRCGKSCRLRWTNYLRPDLKRGLLSESEEQLVIDLHSKLGNRWSKIASHLPGRPDNEIKNHWNTHIKKKLKRMGIDPITHKPISPPSPTDYNQEHQHIKLEEEEERKTTAPPHNHHKNCTTTTNVTTTCEPAESADDFCTDEVPMIKPEEILLPINVDTSSNTCSFSPPATCTDGVELARPPDLDWLESMSAGLFEVEGKVDGFQAIFGGETDMCGERWPTDNPLLHQCYINTSWPMEQDLWRFSWNSYQDTHWPSCCFLEHRDFI